MRVLAVVAAVVASACAHRPPPPVTCGAGWSSLSGRHAEVVAFGPRPLEQLISKVTVDGVSPDLAATLAAVLETRSGQRIKEAPLADDVRRLWQLGVISDARIEVADGVVTFAVTPRPTVVRVLGADGALLRRFRLLAGVPFEPLRFRRIAAAIELGLLRDGHLDAQIAVEQARVGGGVEVCVASRTGPRVTIASVRFPGSARVPEAVLSAAIHGGAPGGVNHVGGTYDEDALALDEMLLEMPYWERGFLDVKIGAPRATRHGPKLDVEVPIHEGPQFRVGAITGNLARVALGVHPGDIAARSRITAARDALARSVGAPSALVYTHLDVATHRVDLEFRVEWRWPWHVLRLWSSRSP